MFKRISTLLIMMFASTLAIAVTESQWEFFCEKTDDAERFDMCLKVDKLCELVGYESKRCLKARSNVVSKPKHPGKLEAQ